MAGLIFLHAVPESVSQEMLQIGQVVTTENAKERTEGMSRRKSSGSGCPNPRGLVLLAFASLLSSFAGDVSREFVLVCGIVCSSIIRRDADETACAPQAF